MESTQTEVAVDLHPFFRVYKDGRIEKFAKFPYTPPSEDPLTGVHSKDVVISPETCLSVRLFLPKTIAPDEKLPVIIYAHGGAFVIESAFSSVYHAYVNSLAAEAKAIAVSIEYRLAPEYRIPACYDDAWTAFKWVASHAKSRQGPEPWINQHADFGRVFLAGDSAGANIAHHIIVRAGGDGGEPVDEIKVVGMILVHPFFGDGKPNEIWRHIAPESSSWDDPMLNPMAHPSLLSSLLCRRVLVCTAERDFLKDRSLSYYDELKKSGWDGELELMETEGEEHCFHLQKAACENAKVLMKRVASFINEDRH